MIKNLPENWMSIPFDEISSWISSCAKEDITNELLLTFANHAPSLIKLINDDFLTKEAVELVVKNSQCPTLSFIPIHKRFEDVCLSAVKHRGCNLEDVPQHIKNYEICLEAIKNYPLALENVPLDLQNPTLCIIALEQGFLFHKNHDIFKNVKICENPDYETTRENLNKMITVSKNKESLKNRLEHLQ